jgi:hypothetical protein
MSFEQSAPVFRRVGYLVSVIRVHENLCLSCVVGETRSDSGVQAHVDTSNSKASALPYHVDRFACQPLPIIDSQVFLQEI